MYLGHLMRDAAFQTHYWSLLKIIKWSKIPRAAIDDDLMM